jgi:hypothetical protein
MPEWYLVIGMLAVLSLLGLAWAPLFWVLPLLVLAVAAPIAQAVLSAAKAEFPTPRPERSGRLKQRALTALLHLIQPLARLIGRLRHGLTPWRRRGTAQAGWGLSTREPTLWFEQWQDPGAIHGRLRERLREAGVASRTGGDLDAWDLEVRGGLLGSARLNLAVEEHGGGKQLFRFRIRPRRAPWGLGVAGVFGLIGLLAGLDGAWVAALPTGAFALWLLAMVLRDSGAAVAAAERAVQALGVS